jgi:hypothetical protein
VAEGALWPERPVMRYRSGDVPTQTDYLSRIVVYISANLETHFEETHRRAAKMRDLELAIKFSNSLLCEIQTF